MRYAKAQYREEQRGREKRKGGRGVQNNARRNTAKAVERTIHRLSITERFGRETCTLEVKGAMGGER